MNLSFRWIRTIPVTISIESSIESSTKKLMDPTLPEAVEVGTTGTVGTLMSQELGSSKQTPQGSSSSGLKTQTPPVSVLCGSRLPKRTQQKCSSISSSSSRNNNTEQKGTGKTRHKTRKKGPPMLVDSEDIAGTNRGKADKKGRTYTAEVVDIKCSNPVSSRLKKLGFSKLSESFA